MLPKPSALHVARGLDPRLGGTSSAVPALARYTGETGRFDNSLAVFRPCNDQGDAVATGLSESRVHQILWQPSSPARIFRAYTQLSSLVKQQSLIQIHGLWESHTAMAAHLAQAMKKPYIVSAHGMLDTWALRQKRWKKSVYASLVERRNLQNASCLCALTRSEIDNYRAFGLRTPIALVPNGVSAPENFSSELFLERWPMLAEKRIVLFLSRIHYKKGLDILCRAWRNVARHAPDAHLVIAGPDSEDTRSGLEKLVLEDGLGDSVTFTGMLDYEMKWSALGAASVFVLPSYSEGFSVAILEALAAGKPVVITKQCNFPDLERREFATVIEPVTGQLEEALGSVLRTPSARLKEHGSAAREFAARNYSWPRIGTAMADVYGWMLGGGIPANVEMVLS